MGPLEVNVLNTNGPNYWLVTFSEPTMASQVKMVLKLKERRIVGGGGGKY